MDRIKVCQTAKSGAVNAVKVKSTYDADYQELVKEANARIEQDRIAYTETYGKASMFIAR